MQKLAEICIRRPVFATMLIMALVVLGLDAYRKLGVDFFPKIDLPIVTVTTTLRGAAPEEVETQVSKRIEEAVNTISGIDDLRSTSAEGISIVAFSSCWTRTRKSARRKFATRSSRFFPQLPQRRRSARDREGRHRRIADSQHRGLVAARSARDHEDRRRQDQEEHRVAERRRPGAFRRRTPAPDSGHGSMARSSTPTT